MDETSNRTAAQSKPASRRVLRRFAGLTLFSAGWLLWMHDMAGWALSS